LGRRHPGRADRRIAAESRDWTSRSGEALVAGVLNRAGRSGEELVEGVLIGVVAADLDDLAVLDAKKLAGGDVELLAVTLRGGALQRDRMPVIGQDVEGY